MKFFLLLVSVLAVLIKVQSAQPRSVWNQLNQNDRNQNNNQNWQRGYTNNQNQNQNDLNQNNNQNWQRGYTNNQNQNDMNQNNNLNQNDFNNWARTALATELLPLSLRKH